MQDDNELMEQVKKGNREAYNELVMRHRVAAISFAYSFILDLQFAEDIVQDVFIKIYVNRDHYQPIFTFKTFLYQSIRNKCIDYLRRRKFEVFIDFDTLIEIADNCTVEDIVFRKDDINSVYEIMNSLEDDYKTALYLFAVENMNYKEIAKVMKKTVPQVKITIFRARKKLKKVLKEVNEDEE